jgi:hypothetical protein
MLPLYYMSYPLVPWLVAAQWAQACNYTPLSLSTDISVDTEAASADAGVGNVIRFPVERTRPPARFSALYEKATS